MTSFLWPAEDGWPYPDPTDRAAEMIDLSAETDDDLLSLRMPSTHVFDDLDPLERRVITSHYGLDGSRPLSINQLHDQLGLSSDDVQGVLGSGLAKLRMHLQA